MQRFLHLVGRHSREGEKGGVAVDRQAERYRVDGRARQKLGGGLLAVRDLRADHDLGLAGHAMEQQRKRGDGEAIEREAVPAGEVVGPVAEAGWQQERDDVATAAATIGRLMVRGHDRAGDAPELALPVLSGLLERAACHQLAFP
jgi:hypothetical protein